MGDLSKNINRSEVRCRCGKCSCHTVDYEVVMIVQDACDHFTRQLGIRKVILDINSGHRCEKHNSDVGGKERSQHLMGTALDINIRGVDPSEVYQYLDAKYPDRLGLGLYKDFVHVDVGRGKARW